MITATILFFVARPVKMLVRQVKICTTGPVEKILSVDPWGVRALLLTCKHYNAIKSLL